MNIFSYQTIKNDIKDILLKEKGSKFIGYAFPVNHEKEVQEKLHWVKELHPKATHHCYAFRVGLKGEVYRANDDGEPSGSAGLPIYNQLLANDLTNILLVVVRYYGGTKLGVSGLVKAYKESAKLTLEQSEIITKELTVLLEIECSFAQQNLIFSLLNKQDAKILDFKTHEKCLLLAEIKKSEEQKIQEILSDLKEVSFALK